ncbi:intersectin-1-like [Olea europaea var. sylvestris]|uniref:intersectin-1-like n=1 Tax=Olea europaea var. sylvestris TaxID=158386 RepID=UPI000C1CDE7C|nr:intersectin-1-like [Olea europaea var. sylvestris]
MMPQPRRKKWTEAEERTLIDKYGEMACNGTLVKMKTREKKYKPIALHVNSVHHVRDPATYPWLWTWKDVSTKVQNMRHQYALVKQKIKKPESLVGGSEEFVWMEGVTHWSNFLRYKEVFGDVPLMFGGNDSMVAVGEVNENRGGFEGSGQIAQFGHLGQSAEGDFAAGIDGVDNGAMDLEFDYEAEEGEENYNGGNKSDIPMREDGDDGFVCEDIEPSGSDTRKRKVAKGLEKSAWGCLVNQLGNLREMETRFEQREVEREREKQQREHLRMENERERGRKWEEMEKDREEREKAQKLRRHRNQDWEAMKRETDERERRREEELNGREWEEKLSRRRSEWKKRIDDMLTQHRAEMGQIQARILNEQQNLTNQLLGIVSQWTSHPTGLSDHTGASSHYLPQMIQNLHHVNGMVHGDARVEGDNQEDQFIVDG